MGVTCLTSQPRLPGSGPAGGQKTAEQLRSVPGDCRSGNGQKHCGHVSSPIKVCRAADQTAHRESKRSQTRGLHGISFVMFPDNNVNNPPLHWITSPNRIQSPTWRTAHDKAVGDRGVPRGQGQRRQSALGEFFSCRIVSKIENLEPGQRCKVLIIPTRGFGHGFDLIGARGQPLQRVRYVHAPSIRGEMAARSGSALRCRSHMQAPQNVQWRL